MAKQLTSNAVVNQRLSESEKSKMMVRLTQPVNDVLRRMSPYRGQKSRVIVDVIKKANLDTIPLIDPATTTGTMLSPTTISVDAETQDLLRDAANRRDCSMNLLLNSALAERFGVYR